MKRKKILGTLRLVRDVKLAEPSPYAHEAPIRAPRVIYNIMAPLADREVVENLWVLVLDTNFNLIEDPILITRGTINSSLAHPREVFIPALLSTAASIILVHNHPSGDPTPSPEDRAITDQMTRAGRVLDIPVIDHVIIGCGRYSSFAELGLL